jgi:hypothetical protein
MNSGTCCCFVDSDQRACFKTAVSGCLELLLLHEPEKDFDIALPELVQYIRGVRYKSK